MRVSAAVEIAGLDVPEMGVPAYPEWLPAVMPEDIPADKLAEAAASLSTAKAAG
jgi:hypothetical protein